jgi:hypothetical protein
MRLCIVVLLVISSWLPATAAESSTERVLRLTQTHYFLGANQLDIAKDAIRIENTGQFGFTIVSRAPKWEVTVFRKDDKVYFSETLAKFEGSGVVSDLIISSKDRHIGGKRPPSEFRFKTLAAQRRTSRNELIEYLPIRNLTCQQVEAVIYATYKVSTEEGIPLYMIGTAYGKDWLTGIDEKGHRKIYLKTTEAKFVNIPKDSFTTPTGYHRVSTIAEAFSGTSARKASEAFEPMFDVGKKGK